MKKNVGSFWQWVDRRVVEVGLKSFREFEKKAGFAPGAIGKRKNALKFPTVEMAEGMCRALRVTWVELWKAAGFIEEDPPAVAEEKEVLQIIRSLPTQVRSSALAMLRGLIESSQSASMSNPPDQPFSSRPNMGKESS